MYIHSLKRLYIHTVYKRTKREKSDEKTYLRATTIIDKQVKKTLLTENTMGWQSQEGNVSVSQILRLTGGHLFLIFFSVVTVDLTNKQLWN